MRTISRFLILIGLLAVELPLAGAETPDDRTKLAGTWKVTSASVGDTAMPAKEREKIRVVFAGEKLAFLGTPVSDKHTTYKIDSSKSPATIDIAPPPGEKQPALGIYRMEGETLTLCFSEGGDSRPVDFKDTKRAIVLVLEKVK